MLSYKDGDKENFIKCKCEEYREGRFVMSISGDSGAGENNFYALMRSLDISK
jgi:hypothetical protein